MRGLFIVRHTANEVSLITPPVRRASSEMELGGDV